ncbi:GNAT family N-acetyltransferase [Methylovirgula sp. 4M-Z18]|uniref:GNAT family N-acetyltransferase n=1 Tax=Methylovirgula sp. 4M-Z18 TaxID=2293567 RepID=UPI000E2E9950|nr:GNAT family N-acetyltransferase [Methylovirgula sp. 4M-Z18]RFB76443.1 GNAT family N-acetyltransferase [Methylovirgula sp. 4M-Z18]
MDKPAWELTTKTGLKLIVRPADEDADAVLDDLFHHVREEDLCFRFLTGRHTVSKEQLQAMTHIDHKNTETYIAFVEGTRVPIATAMLARVPGTQRGEVAISVHADFKHYGIGWELLAFTARQAKGKGLQSIESIESRANLEAIEVEKNMGFTTQPYAGDASLVLVSKQL